MPTYNYKNPKTGEIIEVIQSMNEPHEYEVNGTKWERQFTAPTASVDTKWNPLNSKDFVEKTKNKKGTMGDIYDKAAELGKERERIIGKDPIKEKMINDYKKETGKKHPIQYKERPKNIKIDLSKGKVTPS